MYLCSNSNEIEVSYKKSSEFIYIGTEAGCIIKRKRGMFYGFNDIIIFDSNPNVLYQLLSSSNEVLENSQFEIKYVIFIKMIS